LIDDRRWMAAALALGERGQGRTAPNPNVGCVIVREGRVLGRGWTQAGGRPHAEAMALANGSARGGTAYVTLEPCAHISDRGPACADGLIAAGVSRVVIAATDPDPRTNGQGIARLRAAGIEVVIGVLEAEAKASMAGYFSVQLCGRPFITLKLATSLDGCIALSTGESRWITGEASRAHGHLERARSDMILVGRGTYEADAPRLDVRLPGLEGRSPARAILSAQGEEISDWHTLSSPDDVHHFPGVQRLLIEGGAGAAAAFLKAGLVDQLVLYRAPLLIGGGRSSLGDIGLAALADAQGKWRLTDARMLGSDRLEIYLTASGGA
jgi:diaminohydroxyphosphoribosylaminopyrimidine deaminase / 5-amino-6-(5-phosphoribosylamino)uracil reductase